MPRSRANRLPVADASAKALVTAIGIALASLIKPDRHETGWALLHMAPWRTYSCIDWCTSPLPGQAHLTVRVAKTMNAVPGCWTARRVCDDVKSSDSRERSISDYQRVSRALQRCSIGATCVRASRSEYLSETALQVHLPRSTRSTAWDVERLITKATTN